jgi:hypothetical protein
VPARSRLLALLAAGLAVAAVAFGVWAVSALQFARESDHWAQATGRVVQPDPGKDAAAVRYTDASGREHLMRLQTGDTDDLPVGSVIRIAYDVRPDGSVRQEFAVQPGARTSALAVLAAASAAAAVIALRRSRVAGPRTRVGRTATVR